MPLIIRQKNLVLIILGCIILIKTIAFVLIKMMRSKWGLFMLIKIYLFMSYFYIRTLFLYKCVLIFEHWLLQDQRTGDYHKKISSLNYGHTLPLWVLAGSNISEACEYRGKTVYQIAGIFRWTSRPRFYLLLVCELPYSYLQSLSKMNFLHANSIFAVPAENNEGYLYM